jgi:hypothetical protein
MFPELSEDPPLSLASFPTLLRRLAVSATAVALTLTALPGAAHAQRPDSGGTN